MSTVFRIAPVAVAGMLLLPGVSNAAATEVNTSFGPPTISGQSYNSTVVPDGPAGTFKFDANFCNVSTNLGYRLESRTAELSGGNELLNRTGGSGDTSVLAFPPIDGYDDVDLAPAECVKVSYEIGLQTQDSFRFFVDTWLDGGAVLFKNPGQPSVDAIGLYVDDFILGVRSNPLVPVDPDRTIKGVRWTGANPIFNIDPGNEFRVKIFEARSCFVPPRTVSDRVKTAWDAPFREAVVTASRVILIPSTNPAGIVYEYTASIPEFRPTAGCRYFLGIDNKFRRPAADGGDAAWAWRWDTRDPWAPNENAYRWDGSRWRAENRRYAFELLD